MRGNLLILVVNIVKGKAALFDIFFPRIHNFICVVAFTSWGIAVVRSSCCRAMPKGGSSEGRSTSYFFIICFGLCQYSVPLDSKKRRFLQYAKMWNNEKNVHRRGFSDSMWPLDRLQNVVVTSEALEVKQKEGEKWMRHMAVTVDRFLTRCRHSDVSS